MAAVALAVFSTAFFALGPAVALSRPNVSPDLKRDAGTRRAAGPLLRWSVMQLAVSLALVAAGGLFVRAAIRAASADPGFSLDRQLIVSIDPSLAGYDQARSRNLFRSALQRVRAIPGVQHASVASLVPFGAMREGRSARLSPGDDPSAGDFLIVGAGYFETIGLPLLRGREFTRRRGGPVGQLSGVSPIIIDRHMAKKLFRRCRPDRSAAC